MAAVFVPMAFPCQSARVNANHDVPLFSAVIPLFINFQAG
jgi:hypothetical protein